MGFEFIDISSISSPEHAALGPMSLLNKTFAAFFLFRYVFPSVGCQLWRLRFQRIVSDVF